MLTSVLSPIQIAQPDPAPPWGWNPAATFLTAYNTQAQERRDQEKFNMAMQLERILLPAKAAQAEFTLNQLAYETENMANSYRLQNEMINERRRIIRTGGTGSGSNAARSVVGGTPQSRYGFGAKLTTQAASAPQATVRKVGSGVMPKQSP